MALFIFSFFNHTIYGNNFNRDIIVWETITHLQGQVIQKREEGFIPLGPRGSQSSDLCINLILLEKRLTGLGLKLLSPHCPANWEVWEGGWEEGEECLLKKRVPGNEKAQYERCSSCPHPKLVGRMARRCEPR